MNNLLLILTLAAVTAPVQEPVLVFQDDFKGKLAPGWSWVREHPEAWRVTGSGLEVLLEPGNMWGPQNNARNVLVRTVPDVADSEIEASVLVRNNPSNQYEQVDLVWYFDDSNMVKLGQELVDGKLSIVMGREEKDQCRTIAIIPFESTSLGLKLIIKDGHIRGQFRSADAKEWGEAGTCDLPAVSQAMPKVSLQFYQGAKDSGHWALVTDFRLWKRP